ncbi:glucan endo-1,3-beta-D-glucosidase [Phyllosticta capitalensis]|uniref:glucan endo-1,3-beta-D-glucosidase n=1 Tax=Phyllosticta capitalensis TaxID=121624 RepID=UPI00312D1A49
MAEQASSATTTATASGNRPGTPESDVITPAPTIRRTVSNPFATPYGSNPTSATASLYDFHAVARQPFFRSRRIKKGTVEQPWKEKKDPKAKWITIFPLLGLLAGIALTGFLVWDGLRSVIEHEYCQVMDETFTNGLDEKIWTKEVNAGGYGNGQFDVTTNTDENVFVKDGLLHIKPTLQDQNLIETNNIVDLTGSGGCTSGVFKDCHMATNITNGTIVNPVKSARINTMKGMSIKYGRVEVTAKLPSGDWLWPAIWMMPVNSTYGDWPRSGEIDIMESRGNNYTYSQGGNEIVSSTLHYGPSTSEDGWYKTNVKRKAKLSTYADAFHTFGLEWSEKYLFTYVDSRIIQVMYVKFDIPFFTRGHFPVADSNGTRIVNPWQATGNNAAPFDQDFYLIINVAVGSTNGWFKDGHNSKPWVDSSTTAPRDFWNARNKWYPTWEKGGELLIKSVKVWQEKGYKGC